MHIQEIFPDVITEDLDYEYILAFRAAKRLLITFSFMG